MRMQKALLLVTIFAGPGCFAQLGFSRARTLDAGKTEVALGASTSFEIVNALHPVYPQGQVAVRYGVHDRVELGFKLFTLGGAASAKFGLVRPPGEGFHLAIEPALEVGGFTRAESLGFFPSITVPVLLGYAFPAGHELVLRPRIIYYGELAAGASVGFAAKVSATAYVVPEISVMRCCYGRQTTVTGGVGVLF